MVEDLLKEPDDAALDPCKYLLRDHLYFDEAITPG